MTNGASSEEVLCWQSSGENVIASVVVRVGAWLLTARTLKSFFSADFDFPGASLPVMMLTIMVGSLLGLSRGACLSVLGLRPSCVGDLSLSASFGSLIILVLCTCNCISLVFYFIVLPVVGFHLAAFIVGYILSGFVFHDFPDVKALQRTISFETGMQSSFLALSLANRFFEDPLVSVPPAISVRAFSTVRK
ncbi:probable sodium/metabolite cotransporter BASS5, chloroplastic [Arachis stenosperma]|uniref:probable sodium/metabolite cotransporter BASS5, chloroplastic n=1 Tax=Arachis stenosperma TaxID=217475 RepID=UPI0025AD7178|nr:probable sodium/metabolite cotransporter BASS5, chloroplastic [Arachis stenosperma]